MEKYINEKLYTDVRSYRVFDLDEKAGTAMAIEVERDFKAEFIPGGFSAICTNQMEQYRAPIKDKKGRTPFAITRRKDGIWGIKQKDMIFCWSKDSLTEEGLKKQMELGNTFIEKDSKGREFICVYRMTKSGKIGNTFRKLGRLEDDCKCFYDYNF